MLKTLYSGNEFSIYKELYTKNYEFKLWKAVIMSQKYEIKVDQKEKKTRVNYEDKKDKKLDSHIDSDAKKNGGKKTREDRKFGWREIEFKFSSEDQAEKFGNDAWETIKKWNK